MLKNNGMVKLVANPKNARFREETFESYAVERNFYWAFAGMKNINKVFHSLRDDEFTFIMEDENFEFWAKHI